MEVLIDHKKVKNSPCKEIFSENRGSILQIKQQIVNGNPICILVSGYRGTGKTSLVCQIKEEFKEVHNVLFVNLSINKFEENTTILRRLVRNIYLSYKKKLEKKEIGDEEKGDIEIPLKLLYDRTFYNIKNNSSYKMTNETERVLTTKLNIRHLILIFTTIFTSLNLGYNLIPFIYEFFNAILFSANIFWLIFEVISFVKNKKKLESRTEELCRETLYDDEIAEVKIKTILKKLNDHGYHVVIVIDELDKVEDDSEIESIISNLKPLMLSNTASFMIVSGQKLFYKYTSAKVIDDSLISSFFSKLIHVPILKIDSFKKLFSNIIIEQKNENEIIVKNYRDSLILNSNRIIRRFFNLINEDIFWKNNKAYIKIIEADKDVYKTDSKFLEALSEIESGKISEMNYVEGIKDYLIFHLYIWTQKIKLMGNRSFIKTDIPITNDMNDNNLNWCNPELFELLDELLKKLVEKELLEKSDDKEGEEARFSLSKEIKIKKEDQLFAENNTFVENFRKEFIIERMLADIYYDLKNNYFDNNLKENNMNNNLNDIQEIKVTLFKEGVISKFLFDEVHLFDYDNSNRNINEHNYIRNKIGISNYDRIIHELYRSYIIFIVKEFLIKYNYGYSAIISPANYGDIEIKSVDLMLTNKADNAGDILLQVKAFDINKSGINQIIFNLEKLKNNIQQRKKKRVKCAIFYYLKDQYEVNNNYNNIKRIDKYFSKDIILVNINEEEMHFNSRYIEDRLNLIISRNNL